MRLTVSLLVLLLSSCCWESNGMLESEAGTNDWYRGGIGQVRQLHSPSKTFKALLVTSDQGVLAALDPRDGNIIWRQVLPENFPILASDVSDSYVATLSQNGVVRVWDVVSGTLQFESSAFEASPSRMSLASKLRYQATLGDKLSEVSGDVKFVSFDDGLYVVSVFSSTAQVFKVSTKGENFETLGLGDQAYKIIDKGNGLVFLGSKTTWTFEKESKSVVGKTSNIPESTIIPSDASFSFGIDCREGSVVFVNLISGGTIVVGLPNQLRSAGHSCELLATSQWVDSSVGLALFHAGKLHVLVGDLDIESLKVVTSIKASRKQVFLRLFPDKVGVVHYAENSSDLELEFFSLSGSNVSKSKLPDSDSNDRGVFQAVWFLDESRLAVLFEDDSLALYSSGKLLWVKEEGLADIVDGIFVECPPHTLFLASLEQDDSELKFPGFASRLATQSVELRQVLTDVSGALVQKLPALLSAKSISEILHSPFKLEREKLGKNKVFVALSSRGKLVALSSDTGSILWGRFIGSDGAKPFGGHIFLTKQKSTGATHPEVSVITSSREGSSVWKFDVLSGTQLSRQNFHFRVGIACVLSFVDEHHRSPLLLADTDGSVHFDTDSASLGALDGLSLPFVDYQKNIVKGLSFEGGYQRVRWQMNFGGNEKLSSSAFHDPSEVVQDHWRPAGGSESQSREKYLNKNLLVLATTTVSSNSSVISPSRSGAWVVVYLIDSVSGAVLARIANKDGEGPVHLVLTENVVIFHYLNTRERRFEMSVIEMFVNPSHLGVPHCLQHTYGFPSGARSLGVTSTRRGISPKMVLIGLTSNRVLALPQGLFDTRRATASRKPTAEEQASGILPYRSYLPFPTQSVLSYTNSIHRIRDIVTTDTEMESTSLMMCYGLDMFFAQVAASQSFDMLGEEFNLPFLIATVTLVAVGIIVSRYLSQKKRLSLDWE